jgi:hypothetical protein
MADLKNYLFEQIERVNDDSLDDQGLEKEIKRSKTITESARAIVEITKTQLDAMKYLTVELCSDMNPDVAISQLMIGSDITDGGKK